MSKTTTQDLKSAGIRYKAVLDTDVFTAARARMEYVYANYPADRIVVSWSGGKDSSACLYTALEVAERLGKLPVNVMFLDEEVIYPETVDLAYQHAADPRFKFHWVCVPAKYRNACSEVEPDFIPFDPKYAGRWTHEPPPFALWPAGREVSDWTNPPPVPLRVMDVLFTPTKSNPLINVTGLRAQESFVRYSGLMSSGAFMTKVTKGIITCRPVYDWLDRDIWLAIKERGWVYNLAYDRLHRLGVPVTRARVAPLFHAEAIDQLPQVMLGWPKLWEAIKFRVPGAHAVGIYGGKLHAVERLKGESWYQASVRFLNTLGNPAHRQLMHDWVQQVLDKHAKHSKIPVQEEQICTECALSWKTIARACARGDLHKRLLSAHMSLRTKPNHPTGGKK